MKHLIHQGHGVAQLTELARKITAMTSAQPPEKAFTLTPHRYTSQEIEHFERVRETNHEILRPGITARQAQRDRNRAQRSVKTADLPNIFDEMLAEIGDPDYYDDVLLKSNVQVGPCRPTGTSIRMEQRGRRT